MEQWVEALDWSSVMWWVIPAAGVVVGLMIGLLAAVLRPRPARSAAALPTEVSTPALPEAERRDVYRREGAAVAVDLTDARQRARPIQAWVVDRSVDGLCIEVTNPQSENVILSIRPGTSPEPIPWTLIEVRSCRQVGACYLLGCKFVRTPPYNILMLFG